MKLFDIFKKKNKEPSANLNQNNEIPNSQHFEFMSKSFKNDATISEENISIEDSFNILKSGSMIPPDHPALITLNNLHETRVKEVNLEELKYITVIDKLIDLNYKEILFIKYVNGLKSTDPYLPKYWTFEYNLDLQNTLKKLYEYNFISFANMDIKLTNLTVSELKNILRKYNLKLSGRKQELVDRLIELIDIDELQNLVTEDYLTLTGKGEDILKTNNHIFKTYGLSVEESSSAINSGVKELSSYALNKRITQYENSIENKEYGQASIALLNISQIYETLGDKENELVFSIRRLAMNLLEGALTFKKIEKMSGSSIAQELFNDSKEKYFVAPGTLNRILKLSEELNIDMQKVKNLTWNEVIKLPAKIEKIDFENRFDNAVSERKKDLEYIKSINANKL